jgi:hypothetical protein
MEKMTMARTRTFSRRVAAGITATAALLTVCGSSHPRGFSQLDSEASEPGAPRYGSDEVDI